MQVAVVSDIHGNLVALEAVLSDIRKREVDRIVCLGDVAATGPQPSEVIERLQRIGCPCVSGNTDERLAKGLPDVIGARIPEDQRRKLEEINGWNAKSITESQKRYLSTFRATLNVRLGPNKNLLCYHGSPNSNQEGIFPYFKDDDMGRYLGGYEATVFAGGHTHVQMCRRYLGSLVINPGSVGLPYQRSSSGETHNPVKAEYALVRSSRTALGVELVSVKYSLAELKKAVRSTDMPNQDWWLSDWF